MGRGMKGIILWHPDRLARNSIDGGQIVYLLDTGKSTVKNPRDLLLEQIRLEDSFYLFNFTAISGTANMISVFLRANKKTGALPEREGVGGGARRVELEAERMLSA